MKALVELQRVQPAHLPNGPALVVGGYAVLTTVSARGISTSLVAEWQDEVGERIVSKPTPD